ncbi:hypothetical protein F1D05_35615 [Kribbella qitaiheensis]|uniref:Uncharacterized protein n=1 Tax=Kribbella qitaiheensis TaxID=1544730 RepID=A0A7G6X7P6_9ACTN|nr:hypothetical protein [Kribbella qitaiheensis]QNE22261.1 hypothetical protein F1D05_35615 [Kribbella qitaiheensis]
MNEHPGTIVFRPSFRGAARQLGLLGGLYVVLAVALCVSLSFWVFRPVFAVVAFIVIIAVSTWAFARTFRGQRSDGSAGRRAGPARALQGGELVRDHPRFRGRPGGPAAAGIMIAWPLIRP